MGVHLRSVAGSHPSGASAKEKYVREFETCCWCLTNYDNACSYYNIYHFITMLLCHCFFDHKAPSRYKTAPSTSLLLLLHCSFDHKAPSIALLHLPKSSFYRAAPSTTLLHIPIFQCSFYHNAPQSSSTLTPRMFYLVGAFLQHGGGPT